MMSACVMIHLIADKIYQDAFYCIQLVFLFYHDGIGTFFLFLYFQIFFLQNNESYRD